MLSILKKEDGFWLHIDGKKKALINLGNHGPIVMDALDEASQQAVSVDGDNATEYHPPRCPVCGELPQKHRCRR